MVQKFAPVYNPEDGEEIHRQTRALTREPIDTEDDVEFTIQEVKIALQNMGNKKALGGNGIPNEVWKSVVTILPTYLTEIYNGCLKEGVFPNRWKKAKIIPIVKTGKEGSDEVKKFRPISLLDSCGKVLEKLLINRIKHYMYSREHMNDNQFGFSRKKVDAAMAINTFAQESLDAGEVIGMVSLDVQGAFDA